ncbi:hypothetical protein F4804DRAFT_346769 [Jackrogersella minutella]|nr:hypothetical protein F4804DRAFT_346769 [Jackrogersella minutella]
MSTLLNVKWLARFRLPSISSPPLEVRDYILRSEAATMGFLQKHICIPSPKILDWACESDPSNPLGHVGYILMEKMEGNPLDWQGASPSQKEKVMQQLVDIFLELERHPFDTMGSIISSGDPSVYEIQGFAYHAAYSRGTKGVSGEIGAAYPVDVFLVHRSRLDLLGDVEKDVPSGEAFFLKHPDDKGDHILVNEDFDIVGMIDWEWCQTPVAKFYDGSNELADEELRLAYDKGRKVQRFFFSLGAGSGAHDQKTLIDLFMGLKRAFDPGEEEWEEWRTKALVNEW